HHGIQKGSVLNVVRKVSQPEEASRNGYTPIEGAAYSAASQPPGPQPGPPPELNATFPASALRSRVSPVSLHPQLDALNDLELLVLLRRADLSRGVEGGGGVRFILII
ncbi:unnamed protein product, partial [Symbiodinium microadriaticum]